METWAWHVALFPLNCTAGKTCIMGLLLALGFMMEINREAGLGGPWWAEDHMPSLSSVGFLNSSQLVPQGNAGLVWSIFPVPFSKQKSEIYMFRWNLPISKYWTFEMNKNGMCPTIYICGLSAKPSVLISRTLKGLPSLFHTPEPHPP